MGSGVSPALLTPQTVNYELLRRYLKFGSHFTETFLIEKASYNLYFLHTDFISINSYVPLIRDAATHSHFSNCVTNNC